MKKQLSSLTSQLSAFVLIIILPAVAWGHVPDSSILNILGSHELTLTAMVMAFLTAIFLGAVHALSPGHGKALVAAYLVGSRGTVAHAMWLAVIVTATHIFSVVLVGVVALIAAQYVVPEYYMPFISLVSGLIIVGIGVWLIIKRMRGRAVTAEHDHLHPHPDVSWKMLLTLGVTGGIVPCPSAMVVMLTAIAIGRIAFGLALIIFFSLGLTISLSIVGIIAIKASDFLDRFARTQALTRWLPLASAIVITILGLAIVYRGFFREIGHAW
jgi:ABC-type nickel/cobalt efflux system permease component RcnA